MEHSSYRHMPGSTDGVRQHTARPRQSHPNKPLDRLLSGVRDCRISLKHLLRARGRLLKAFPQARHSRSASIDNSTAILLTLGRESSRASAISRTSPARVQLMRHCQRRSLSKKQIVRLTTKAPSWPDIYQGCTRSNRPHTNRSIQANYIDTLTKQKAALIKTCTLVMVSGPQRGLMGRRQRR